MKKFEDSQKERQVELIRTCKVFNGDKGNGIYKEKPYPYILENGENNLYAPIKDGAIGYFDANNISWWGGNGPTGNTLSSQIACLNHLFALRDDKEAVLAMLKGVSDQFVDVLPISYGGEKSVGCIAFEVVSKNNRLNEGNHQRGANCTSIDALMHAVDRSGKKWLIPIEWKFTETYSNADKSTEDREGEPKGANGRGDERMRRYNDLITNSKQLKSLDEYQGSIYYRDPFYQLMRQTLLAEQMIAYKDIDADDFLHIHVIPKGNEELLEKKCDLSGKDMESTWRDMINCQEKYVVIDPADLMKPITCVPKYKALCEYLAKRYW